MVGAEVGAGRLGGVDPAAPGVPFSSCSEVVAILLQLTGALAEVYNL